LLPPSSDSREEFRGFALGFARKSVGFTGKRILRQRLANGFNQRLGQARMGSHEVIVLRE
jgi:hypothetical protein